MALLVHMATYEVVERTHTSNEVIGTTSCGMYIGNDICASSKEEHVTCPSCLTHKK
jgi:hypothetical protein